MTPLRATEHEFRQRVPDPTDVVYDWHRRHGAFTRLAPPWQPVRLEREAEDLASGTAVLRMPAGRRWVAQHLADEHEPGLAFADRLTSRPFVVPVTWHHHHELIPDGDGTVVVDRVTTTVPRSLLEPMFAYRHRQLADDLASHRPVRDLPRLTVAVTGASGLVGSALSAFLTTGGHTVVRLVRRDPASSDERRWNPDRTDPEVLEGVDAVVHLAGHGISGRFTEEHKRRIRSSRVGPTDRLASAAAAAGVAVFACASAIGIYGADRGEEELTEDSDPGDDFLAGVVRDWEAAALAHGVDGMRVVTVRTGIVQSPHGGALRLQRPLFALGLGGPLGSGEQWQSWIGIDDVVDVYHRVLVDDGLTGPLNATAPNPVRQRAFAEALGRALRRPARLPTPTLGPRLLLGREGAREVALADQRVVPARLLGRGHRFRFTEVEEALRHLLGGTAR